MKKISKKHQHLVFGKLEGITKIAQGHRNLVLARLEQIKYNPERLLDWDEVANALTTNSPKKKFNDSKFNDVLTSLEIQKRLKR